MSLEKTPKFAIELKDNEHAGVYSIFKNWQAFVKEADTMNGFEKHLTEIAEEDKIKAVREFVDFSDYTTAENYDIDGKLIGRMVVEKSPYIKEDQSEDILSVFRAYDVKSCKIAQDVMECLIDINPVIFDGVELDVIPPEILDDED